MGDADLKGVEGAILGQCCSPYLGLSFVVAVSSDL